MGGALAQARACLTTQKGGAAAAAAKPAAPDKPALGIKGAGAKPVQMSGEAAALRRPDVP
jgi:hypothetical protein